MKVLIADDDRQLCHAFNVVLRQLGWEIVLAYDAAQALVSAKDNHPDVIVLDINMPGGTGIGALEKLRMNMKTSMIPVLVLSATVDKSIEETALNLGAVGFMHKPVEVEALHNRLEGILKGAPGL